MWWLAAACVAGLLVGVSASSATDAPYAPRLVVHDDLGASLDFRVTGSSRPTAKLVILSPPFHSALGIRINPPYGFGIGPATATYSIAGGQLISLEGRIRAGVATDIYTSGPVQRSVADAALGCTGTVKHDAYWLATLKNEHQVVELPVFVDMVPVENTTTPGLSLALCTPPPAGPEGLGNAANPASLVALSLTLGGMFLPARVSRAAPRWTFKAAPFATNGDRRDETATVGGEAFAETAYTKIASVRTTLKPATVRFRVLGSTAVQQAKGLHMSGAVVWRLTTSSTSHVTRRRSITPGNAVFGEVTVRRLRHLQRVYVQASTAAAQRNLACPPTSNTPCVSSTASGFRGPRGLRHRSRPADLPLGHGQSLPRRRTRPPLLILPAPSRPKLGGDTNQA